MLDAAFEEPPAILKSEVANAIRSKKKRTAPGNTFRAWATSEQSLILLKEAESVVFTGSSVRGLQESFRPCADQRRLKRSCASWSWSRLRPSARTVPFKHFNIHPAVRAKAEDSSWKGSATRRYDISKAFYGCVTLCDVVLDWEERGYSVNGKNVNNLRFANDIVLISSSTAEMEKMVNELNAVSRRIGLEMNMFKTQLMVNQWCDTGTVKLDGEALQRVESYVFVERELNMMNNITPEPNRRRRAAWAAFGSIREVTNQVSDPDLKASIFNASVLPAKCYATETWPDNETIVRAIRTSHHALERSFLKINRRQQWQQGLRSSDLRERSRLKDPLQYMAHLKHRWACHLLRRTDDRWSL
uniref:Reverse transcriptase domain-containing protein n=1 Tax=Haemonchus contortus TaxID=6289 RepID=A0A7I4Y986_HAECO